MHGHIQLRNTEIPLLPAPPITEAGLSDSSIIPKSFSTLEEDNKTGKESRQQAVSEVEMSRDMGSSLQVPWKQTQGEVSDLPIGEKGDLVTYRSHLQVAPGRSVNAFWKEGIEVYRYHLQIRHPKSLLRQCQAPYGLGWRVLAVQRLLAAP